jgi:2-C-methyl-D-erythritol 2,4-cyclodiphosphate synthase
MGLLGHSDADALLHAICDALLGAAGMPDIGQLYPDTDPQFSAAPSLRFLEDVGRRLAIAGWRTGNVDSTVVAQKPRIAPYVPEMRAAISRALSIDIERVAVKATTNEGLGSLGSGEGIACYATASIVAAL